MENKDTDTPRTDKELDKALDNYLRSPLAEHRANMTEQEKQAELEEYRRLHPDRVIRHN